MAHPLYSQKSWYTLGGIEQVAALNEVLDQQEQQDTEEGLRIASMAFTMARWHRDSIVMAYAQLRIARFYKLLSKYDSAQGTIKEVLAVQNVLPDAYKVLMYNETGDIAMQTGQLDEAMSWYLKSFQLCQAASLSDKLYGDTYYGIGFLYLTRFEYDTALYYFHQSLQKHSKDQDVEGQAKAFNGIGLIYMRKDSFLLARTYFFQSLNLINTLHKPRFEAKIYNNIGITYEDLGDPETAILYYEKSLRIKERLKDLRGIASTYGNLSDNFRQVKAFDKALEYNQKSIELAERLKALELLVTARKRAYLIYEDMGKYKEALKAHKLFKRAEDSLNSNLSREHINILIAEYEIEKSEAENDRLQALSAQQFASIKQHRISIFIATAGLVVVLVLAFLLYKLYRKYRTSSEHLEQNRAALTEAITALRIALHENHVVTGILVHDLRAPLQRIKGLMDIMMRSSLDKEELQNIMETMHEQLRQGQRIIQDLLLLEREEGQQPEDFELNTFVQDILTFYQAESYRKDIALQLFPSSKPIVLYQDKDTFRRILDNLLSNALKFSPPGGSVVVKIRTGETDALVYISDQGPGFTAEDKAQMFKRFARLSAKPTGGESSTGLGLAIVHKLTKQLNGTIMLSSEVEVGASFELSIPLRYHPVEELDPYMNQQSEGIPHKEG
jgi:signal transduction histidine kinase